MSKENKEEVKPEEKKKDDGKGLLPPDELVSSKYKINSFKNILPIKFINIYIEFELYRVRKIKL